MEVYEDLDGLICADGRIDLARYSERLKKEAVIKRFHNTSLEKAIEGSKKYLSALSGTSVKYAATLPWPHKCSYAEIKNYKEALAKVGVKEFFSWNTNHTLLDVSEMHALLGRGEEFYTVNRYRTLSLDGVDMSEFNPNWRG